MRMTRADLYTTVQNLECLSHKRSLLLLWDS